MVRFNKNSYIINKNEIREFMTKLKFLFSDDYGIYKNDNTINTLSSCNRDFQKHFFKIKHKNDNLNSDLFYAIQKFINKRMNNSFEMFYETKLEHFNVNNNDIWKVIQNCEEIDSYLFLNNYFLVKIYDDNSKFSSIIKIDTKSISDGWSPQFHIEKGFFDEWYHEIKKKELSILNNEYNLWKLNPNKKLFSSLYYSD